MPLFQPFARYSTEESRTLDVRLHARSLFPWVIVLLCALLWSLSEPLLYSADFPVITAQPQKWVTRVGSDHSFSVTATGSPPLGYQWRRDGVPLSGATSAVLLLSNIQNTNAGLYDVIVSNGVGNVMSETARLTVRGPEEPYYPSPQGGWVYLLEGGQAASSATAALDGGWNHNNASDSWSGDGRGSGIGLPGGIGTTNGILTFEDAVATGGSDVDNRRFYLTRSLGSGAGVTNADLLLDTGVTLTFRGRLTPPAPADLNTELTNAPNGLINLDAGKGMFGLRQSGGGGGIISFSLSKAIEDTGPTTTFNLGQAGLHMNSLFGNTSSPFVNPDGPGTRNILALDPAQFHEFWINIQTNGADPGTHRVSIYLDGALIPTVFNVTSGTGSESGGSNYVALGLGGTAQRGAFDLVFFGYQPGILLPRGFNEPVTFLAQPADALSMPGQMVSFAAQVDGTPQITFQWYRDNQPLAGATNLVYTTPVLTVQDDDRLFSLVASNICGSVTSRVAVLDLLLPPTIVQHPQSVHATNGDVVTFTVVAESPGAITYQWRFSDQLFPDQTSSTLTLVQASLAYTGRYDVIVANIAGAVTSQVAVLTVDAFDYGDAPDVSFAYHTVLTNDGARHRVVSGFHLGGLVDAELHGWRHPAALGDDETNVDDEDGVRFLSELVAGQITAVEVVASASGLLNAWIDFEGNGSWLEPMDRVFTNVALGAGTNLLHIFVPAQAPTVSSYGRFRFSSNGDATFRGPSHDGEVEDYSFGISRRAGLTVAGTVAPLPIAAGSNLTYTITVSNAGPSDATFTTIDDTLPAGANFVSGQTSQGGGCTYQGGLVSCFLETIPPGASASATIVIRVPAVGLATNEIIAYASQSEQNFEDNFLTLVTLIEASPVVTTQPQGASASQGTTVQFTAVATGALPLYYQWRHGNVALSGATNNTLTLTNLQAGDGGTYLLVISNHVGVALSQSATLSVIIPPAITQHPVSASRFAGGSVIFSVGADGTQPFIYQWFFRGTNVLSAATNAQLQMSSLTTTQAGPYHVEVRNGAGLAVSQSADLVVQEADFGDAPDPAYPTLTVHDGPYHLLRPGIFLGTSVSYEGDGRPDGLAAADADDGVVWPGNIQVGMSVPLAVVASTNGLLDAWIDWNGDGFWTGAGEHVFVNQPVVAGTNHLSTSIPSAATPGLTFARFRFRTVGSLDVTGPAQNGEVEDYPLTIQGLADLVVGLSTRPAIVATGSNYLCVATITNRGPSAAQGTWLEHTLPTGSVLVVALPSQGSCTNGNGLLRCVFGTIAAQSGAAVEITLTPTVRGLTTNRVVVGSSMTEVQPADNAIQNLATVLDPPVISQQPVSKTVTNSGSATFSVTAVGDELRYQWRFGGTALSNATNASLVIAPAMLSDEGEYTVVISNRAAVVISQVVTFTVLAPPSVVTQPLSQVVVAGTNVTLAVLATGTAPLRYLWRFNGIDLPGATNTTYTIMDAQSDDEGTYQVWIANEMGVAVSQPATLGVVIPPSITVPPAAVTALAGRSAQFMVEATGTGPLNYRWYFGGNLVAGANGLELILPAVGTNSAGNYSVTVSNAVGVATSGVVTLTVLEADFGDAPDPEYPTMDERNGAYHIIRRNVYLGTTIDHEPDGRPTLLANGDDIAGSDDEDGIRILTPLRQGQLANIEVIASTNGFLDAWIDFDVTGLWLEAGEQIFQSHALVAGTNRLWFGLTPTAVLGDTIARFRFSTVGGLPPTGRAEDGEVEDYRVTVVEPFDLAVIHTQVTPEIFVGNPLSFGLQVSNQFELVATDVRLTNFLPQNVTFVQASTTIGSCTQTNGIVVCDLGTMSAGTVADIIIRVIPQQGGNITNVAVVAANEFDPEIPNDRSEGVTRVVGSAGTFRRNDPLNLAATGPADLYPSTILVSGVASIVERVTVTISNLNHAFPDDVDILLVGPSGTNVMLMSDAGGGDVLTDVTLTFADAASLPLPSGGTISSGTVRPSNYDTSSDNFPTPAPLGPFGRTLSVFNGSDPNGVWALYVQDDEEDDFGLINDGWSLQITTLDPLAEMSVVGQANPNPVAVGTNLTYNFSVHNAGPSTATGVVLYDDFPSGFQILTMSSSQGSCSNLGGSLACHLGAIASGAGASVLVTARPTVLGVKTNWVSVNADQLDINQSNNRSAIITAVEPVADLMLSMGTLPVAISLGEVLHYDFRISNPGLSAVTDVVLSNTLAPHAGLVSVMTDQGACSNDNGTVRCDLGMIPGGASVDVHIVVQPIRIGSVNNLAIVSAREFDPTGENNRITATTAVGAPLPPFWSADAIVVPAVGSAAPYPSIIHVAGVTGTLHGVTVTLSNVSHSSPNDLDILLVGPNGNSVMLCSDAGGAGAATAATLTFSDGASAALSGSGPLANGIYLPTNLEGANDPFPGPAPTSAPGGTLMGFRGTDPNGAWSLYVVDDASGNAGLIEGGWSLQMTLGEPLADLSVAATAFPSRVAVGSNLVYSIVIRNNGPGEADGVSVTDSLPGSAQVLSVSASQGACSLVGSVLKCQLGNIGAQAEATLSVMIRPSSTAALNSFVDVTSLSIDLSLSNNTTAVTTPVGEPPVVLTRPLSRTVVGGATVMFSVTASGDTPFAYQWLVLGADIVGATNADLILSHVNRTNIGNYSVRIFNPVGSTLSGAATLLVLERPGISAISPQTLEEDSISGLIAFVVGDFETEADNLFLSAQTSNSELFPPDSIVLSGSGSNRTVTLTPAPDRYGAATITITTADTDDLVATSAFLVTVLPVNDPPTLSAIQDQEVAENGVRVIPIIIGDAETSADALTLHVAASNTTLFPAGSVGSTGSGSNRVVTLTPAPGRAGTAVITIRVSDGQSMETTSTFVVTVIPNAPPVISAIGPQQTLEDVALPDVHFVVGDQETPADALLVSVRSSHPALIPQSQLMLSGTGSNRVVHLTPGTNLFGSAVITLTVEDASGAQVLRTFDVSVLAQNDRPTLSLLANQTMQENETNRLPVAVRDEETPAASLVLRARSTNQVLLPDAAIQVGGTGPNRTLSLTPAVGAIGSTLVTFWVEDPGSLATTNTFVLTVIRSNRAPVITTQPRSQIVSNGANVSLSAVVAGSLPLSFQWRRDGIAVPNGTNLALSLSSIQPSQAGAYTLTASNAAGLTVSVPALVQVETADPSGNAVLIPGGAVWKYRDTGEDLGTAWRPVAYNDSAWSSGPAELGYGDDVEGRPEATVISFGGNASSKHITTYFRRAFFVNNPAVYTNLIVDLLRDDGAVVYLNGSEVVRSNMPSGTITRTTLASVSAGGTTEATYFSSAINPALLIAGTNVIAVEIHQVAIDSSDVSFDLVLRTGGPARSPTLTAFPDVVMLEDSSTTVAFTIDDPDSLAFSLALTATSSNQVLIPNANLRFEGNGTARTLRIAPAPNLFGSAVVTASVSDGTNTVLDTFNVTVVAVNDPATLDELPDLRLTAGTGDFDVNLTGITRGPTNEASTTLVVNATTSDAAIMSIRARTYTSPSTTGLQKIRAGTVPGMATVTMSVSDSMASNNLIARTFTTFVSAVGNSLPVVSSIAPQSIAEDSMTGPLTFTVSDAESPAAQLTNRVRSSNQALLPDSAIQIIGTGATRTLNATPQPNQSGTTTVTLQVIDAGFAMVSTSFTITVGAANDAPFISSLADQTIMPNGTTAVIPFTVSDVETPAAQLTVTASSSDPILVPATNIVLGGSGTNRALRIMPVAGQSGSALISLTVSDGTSNRVASFTLNVTGGNSAPLLSDLLNVEIFEDTATPVLTFTIGDDQTALANLRLTAASSDSVLVPLTNIVFGGSGSNRTVVVTPAPNGFGTAVITVQLEDAAGAVVWDNFFLTVHPVNDPPGLDAVPNAVVGPETGPVVVALTGLRAGPPNELQSLALSATSSTPGLLADPVVEYSPGNVTGTLRLSAVGTSNGVATVTVTVHDGQAQNSFATRQFSVTVQAVVPPVIVEQPQSQTVGFGEAATLRVRATGAGPLTYQWYREGEIIAGATQNSWTVAAVTPANTGRYWVAVGNPAGTTNSAVANLSLAVEIVEITVATTVTVRFTTAAGQLHTLETSNTMVPSSWSSLGSLTGDGSVRSLSDTSPVTGMRWYRIRTN